MLKLTDQYTNRYRKDLKDDVEVYEFLESVFPDLDVDPVKDSYASFNYSFFSYLGDFVTKQELASMFGSIFTTSSTRTKLARLLKRKELMSCALNSMDMGANKSYKLTKAGIRNISLLLPDSAKGGLAPSKGGGFKAHAYATGLSILNIMLRQTPFSYQMEVSFTSPFLPEGGPKKYRSVCSDTLITLLDGSNRTVYLEQDMGTELTKTLIEKIQAYERLGVISPHNPVLYSSHKLVNVKSRKTFSITKINELVEDMKACHCNTLRAYYHKEGNRLTYRELFFLECLMARLNLCDLYHKGHIENVDELEKRERKFLTDSTPIEVKEKNPADDFSLEDLAEYAATLEQGINPYMLSSYNREQYMDTKAKFRKLTEYVTGVVYAGSFNYLEQSSFLKGCSVFMMPSVLLANDFDYVNYETGTKKAAIEAVVSKYFDYNPSSYRETGNFLRLHNDYPAIAYKNTYTLRDGSVMAIEHIGKDLGGYMRALTAALISQEPVLKTGVTLVCVCDDMEDMEYFCLAAEYYCNNVHTLRKELKSNNTEQKRVRIYFLLDRNIGSNGRLSVLGSNRNMSYIDIRNNDIILTESTLMPEEHEPNGLSSKTEGFGRKKERPATAASPKKDHPGTSLPVPERKTNKKPDKKGNEKGTKEVSDPYNRESSSVHTGLTGNQQVGQTVSAPDRALPGVKFPSGTAFSDTGSSTGTVKAGKEPKKKEHKVVIREDTEKGRKKADEREQETKEKETVVPASTVLTPAHTEKENTEAVKNNIGSSTEGHDKERDDTVEIGGFVFPERFNANMYPWIKEKYPDLFNKDGSLKQKPVSSGHDDVPECTAETIKKDNAGNVSTDTAPAGRTADEKRAAEKESDGKTADERETLAAGQRKKRRKMRHKGPKANHASLNKPTPIHAMDTSKENYDDFLDEMENMWED